MSIVEWKEIRILAGGIGLTGDLAVPDGATALVLFAHGTGSSRFSPRNRRVATELQNRGLGTLLLDLLTPEEEARDFQDAALRFDVEMLADRVVSAAHWLRSHRPEALHLGYFGASTGAAAALIAAAHHPDEAGAVVSRGGRPDLAMSALPRVRAATLLIVGGHDRPVIQMNRRAYDYLECEKRLEIIPGATHLFEEPGALTRVAVLAGEWFVEHLIEVPAVAGL
jgi:dienelactone hydrolase